MYSQNLRDLLNNRLGLYTADQYNQLKHSIGQTSFTPHSLTPRLEKALNYRMAERDKKIMEMIETTFNNETTDQERITVLRRIYSALQDPDQMW